MFLALHPNKDRCIDFKIYGTITCLPFDAEGLDVGWKSANFLFANNALPT